MKKAHTITLIVSALVIGALVGGCLVYGASVLASRASGRIGGEILLPILVIAPAVAGYWIGREAGFCQGERRGYRRGRRAGQSTRHKIIFHQHVTNNRCLSEEEQNERESS